MQSSASTFIRVNDPREIQELAIVPFFPQRVRDYQANASFFFEAHPQAFPAPTCVGVRVRGEFVSISCLRALLRKSRTPSLPPPDWTPCRGVHSRLSSRLMVQLLAVGRVVIHRMILSCQSLPRSFVGVPQMMITIRCPQLPRSLIKRLLACLSSPDSSDSSDSDVEARPRARIVDRLESQPFLSPVSPPSLSSHPSPDTHVGVSQGMNIATLSSYVDASYLALSALEATSQVDQYSLPLDYIRAALELLQVVCSSQNGVLHFLAAAERFRQHWKDEWTLSLDDVIGAFPQAGKSKDSEKESTVMSIFRALLECVAVASVCRVAGITRDMADLRAIGVYLREEVMTIAKNLVDFVSSVVKVCASGDFSNFFSRVASLSMATSGRRVAAINSEFRALLAAPRVPSEGARLRLRYALMVDELSKIARASERDGEKSVASNAVLVGAAILEQLDELNRLERVSTARKEPLFLFGRSEPGSGKSLTPLVVTSVLSRLYRVPPEVARGLIYNWAVGHDFQEGFNNAHTCIYMDEAWSVSPDLDPTAAVLGNDMLRMVSPIPSVIPCAYENAKGKFTTSNISLIVANTNASDVTLSKLFEAGGANLRRRAYELRYYPKGVCLGANNTFLPDRMPAHLRTLEGLASVMDVQVVSFVGGVEQIAFSGNLLQFPDWLYKVMEDRLSGDAFGVSQWLGSLASYQIPAVVVDKPLELETLEHGLLRIERERPPDVPRFYGPVLPLPCESISDPLAFIGVSQASVEMRPFPWYDYLVFPFLWVHSLLTDFFRFSYPDFFNGFFMPWDLSFWSFSFLFVHLIVPLFMFRLYLPLWFKYPRDFGGYCLKFFLIAYVYQSLSVWVQTLILRGRIYVLNRLNFFLLVSFHRVGALSLPVYESLLDFLDRPISDDVTWIGTFPFTFPTNVGAFGPVTNRVTSVPSVSSNVYLDSYYFNMYCITPLWSLCCLFTFTPVILPVLSFFGPTIYSLSFSSVWFVLNWGALTHGGQHLSELTRQMAVFASIMNHTNVAPFRQNGQFDHSALFSSYDMRMMSPHRRFLHWFAPRASSADSRTPPTPLQIARPGISVEVVGESQSAVEYVGYAAGGFTLLVLLLNWKEVLIHLVLLGPKNWYYYWFFRASQAQIVVLSRLCATAMSAHFERFNFWAIDARLVISSELRRRTVLYRAQWQVAHSRLREYVTSAAFKRLLAVAAIGGVAAYMFKRKFFDSDDDDSSSVVPKVASVPLVDQSLQTGVSEAAKMPLVYTPPPDLPHEMVEVLGKMVPVVSMNRDSSPRLVKMDVRGGSLQYTALERLRSNYLRLSVEYPTTTATSHAIRIRSRVMSVAHIFSLGKPESIVLRSMRDPNSVVAFSPDEKSYKVNVAGESCIMPNYFPTGTGDVRKALGSEKHSAVLGDKVVLLAFRPEDDLYGEVVSVNSTLTYGKAQLGAGRTYTGLIGVTWYGDKMTIGGDCMRLLFRIRGGGTFDFLGYHIGASAPDAPFRMGFVKPTSGPELESEADAATALADSPAIVGVPECKLGYDVNFDYIPAIPPAGTFAYRLPLENSRQGLVGRTLDQLSPARSRLIPTPFSDVARAELDKLDPTLDYQPALLSTEIRFDTDIGLNRYMSPFEDGCNRPDPALAVVSPLFMEEFSRGIKTYVKSRIPFGSRRLLNVDEALSSAEGLNSVSMNKASGLPDGGKKGAYVYSYYDDGVEKRVVDERLRAEIACTLVERGSGLIGSYVTSASLKDELVSKKKRDGLRTRIFEVVSMDSYLIDRMYSGDSVMAINFALRSLGNMVGINAASSDWNAAFDMTDPALHGGVVEDFDYGWMDKRIPFPVMMMVLDILHCLVVWCTGMDEFQSHLYARHLMGSVRPVRRVDGAVLFGYAANLSGGFWTTIINTVCNPFYWYHSLRSLGKIVDFDDMCRRVYRHSLYYGDDTRWLRTFHVSNEDIVAAMAQIGQVIQNAGLVKGAVGSGSASFLKRGFRRVGDRVFCPLELASLYKSLLCYEPSDAIDSNERHYQTLRSLWEEAVFHPDEVKHHLRSLVMKCLQYLPRSFWTRPFRSDAELLTRWDSKEFKVWALG